MTIQPQSDGMVPVPDGAVSARPAQAATAQAAHQIPASESRVAPAGPDALRRGNSESAKVLLAQSMQAAIADSGMTVHELSMQSNLVPAVIRQVLTVSSKLTPSWRIYATVLDALGVGVDQSVTVAIRRYWQAAAAMPQPAGVSSSQRHLTPVARPQSRLYPAAVMTREEEIQAATPADFADLLRLLKMRSGTGATEIGRRSGISRSQVYELMKAGRTSLPTRSGQVVAFARACGLSSDKIGLLTSLWGRLMENASLDDCLADGEHVVSPGRQGPAGEAGDDPQTVQAFADQVIDRFIKVAGVMQPAPVPDVHRRHRALITAAWVVLAAIPVAAVPAIMLITQSSLVNVVTAISLAVVPAVVVIAAAVTVFRVLRAAITKGRVWISELRYRAYGWRWGGWLLPRQAGRRR